MFVTENKIEFQGITYNATHGGPFDRGSADSYYGRPQDPHKYPNGTGNAPRIGAQDLSRDDVQSYLKGYEYNELLGSKKDYD